MRNVLITGAAGFVGRVLCKKLASENYGVRPAVRSEPDWMAGVDLLDPVVVGGTDGATAWRDALTGMDAVVHLAARVHVMRETGSDPLAAFRRVNVTATERLARQAEEAGVKRFVYVSSIKVNGESSGKRPYTADDRPTPQDPYAQSKWEAEQLLLKLAQESAMEVVIVRPPLVYGPYVKGNFLRLLDLIARGIPLPFRALNNRRSLVSVDNLTDLLRVVIEKPAAANQVFLVSDGVDLSTRELVHQLAAALDRPVRMISVPRVVLKLAGAVTGRSAEIQRLTESLQVDIAKTQDLLGWRPPVSVARALRKTADWYRSDRVEHNA